MIEHVADGGKEHISSDMSSSIGRCLQCNRDILLSNDMD